VDTSADSLATSHFKPCLNAPAYGTFMGCLFFQRGDFCISVALGRRITRIGNDGDLRGHNFYYLSPTLEKLRPTTPTSKAVTGSYSYTRHTTIALGVQAYHSVQVRDGSSREAGSDCEELGHDEWAR
jgi:hypothetical protein